MSEELDQNRSVLARYTQSLGIDEPLAILERRVRGLHPVLRDVEFCHRWGGPILIAESWQPVFARHPRCPQELILGAYSGHGVALSVYLARGAVESLLGQIELPDWGKLEHGQISLGARTPMRAETE